MKHLLRISAVALMCTGLFFSSCNKKDDNNPSVSDETALAANADDEANTSNEHEAAMQEADDAMNASGLAGGRAESAVCGAIIDSTVAGQRTITYDGTSECGIRKVKRSGTIVLKLYNATRWRDAGAVLSVTFNNYKVTKQNGGTTTLNGTGKIYNELGGLRKQLGREINTLKHRIRFSGLTMTRNNKTFTDWGIAKTRTFSASGDLLTVSVSGDTTLGGNLNVGTWGTGRYGEKFYTRFAQPLVANSSCGFAAPTSGQKIHQGLRRTLTVTFGVDQNGTQVTSGCAYGYKWEFVGLVRTSSGIVAY